MADAIQDVRYALRQYRREPGFSALLVITLAIGIGANAAMTGAIDRLLLRAPEHVRDPDRVVRLLLVAKDSLRGEIVSAKSNYPTLLDFAREVEAFESVAAFSPTLISFGEGSEAVEVRASVVSASYFSVFGVRPAFGRLFVVASDSDELRAPIAVLSHSFWQGQLGGDSAIVGRAYRVGTRRYTVVGVAPSGFHGVGSSPADIWLPIAVAAETDLPVSISLEDRGSAWLSMVARLRPGRSAAAAEQQASSVWRAHNAPSGRVAPRRVVAASIVIGRGPDRPREVNIALWLGAVSVLVLLIACANVANLLLARAFARRGEMGVRLAMGAGRGRLARQMLAEATLLAVLGGAAGLYVAAIGGRIVHRHLVPEGVGGQLLDYRLLIVTAVTALGTGALIGLVSLFQSTSPNLTGFLRERDGAVTQRSSGTRMTLLGVQATLCMMLLILAGLFTQSLRRVQALDLGMDVEHTLMATVNLGAAAMPRPEIQAVFETMLQRVRSVDGVDHAALAARDPFTSGRAIPAHTPKRSEESLWHRQDLLNVPKEVIVDSGFFRALRTTSLEGRDFASGDRQGAPRVAIVNENLARMLWPGESPLGQCILLEFDGGDCAQVIGVVRGFLRRSILERDELVVYLPMAQADRYVRPGSILIAASADPSMVAERVRQVLQSVRSDLPAVTVALMRDILEPEFRPWEAAATLFGMFAMVAFVIAVVGLYGVVAFTAARRSRDVAIRLALGARPRHVIWTVAGGGLAAVAAGLTGGALAAMAVRHWIGALLFQTSPSDPSIIGGVAGFLFAVAVVASIVPTLRVIRQNPVTALRVD